MMRIYAPRNARYTARPATERQRAYVNALCVRLYGRDNAAEAYLALCETDALSTVTAASETIKRLQRTLQAPAAPAPAAPAAPAAPLALGMYRKDGEVYRVVNSQYGKPYAKRLNPDTGKFEYAAGVIRTLSAADRMSLSEAAEYGKVIGRCCVCGATLTDPESVARGIGPICAKRV